MAASEKLGVEEMETPKTIMVDYGGPNVAKPLHVGHLRSAIIGESVKRILRYKGNKVIGDIHLGDWGYQMGLIITELQKRKPELPYFDENFTGEYPKEAPFTIGELEEIYPTASAYAKEHEEYREKALQATFLLQNGYPGFRAIWNHIMAVSVADLKKNYANLNVSFDLWKGEADAQKYIPDMVEMLKEKGYAHYDEGALVVDVQEETDKKEVPPCMILKSDGAALYDTTDLATLVEREELYQPDEVIYVVDKRQELHFVQVFRCAFGIPTTIARTGRFKIPRFLSLSIFSLQASWITPWIDLIPPPFFELTLTTEYPFFLKYSAHASFHFSSARSALFKRMRRALFFPSSSMSGFRLLTGSLASTSSITRSISLIFSCIIRFAFVICPGYH